MWPLTRQIRIVSKIHAVWLRQNTNKKKKSNADKFISIMWKTEVKQNEEEVT